METKTDNLIWKKSILEAAKLKQQALIDDFQERIDTILKTEKAISEEGMDLDRQAKEDYGKMEVNLLADQLNFAVAEMDLLNTLVIEEPLHDHIQFGSVVVTNQKVFFVAVSVEEFKVNSQKIFGISTKAPIYQDLKGKKAGDLYLNQIIKEVL